MKKLITFSLLILCGYAKAQNVKASGTLEKVEHDGFYKILLSPQQAPFISADFANIRIVNSAKAEVPYILKEEQPVYVKQQFKEYEMLEKRQLKNAYTAIKLLNPSQAAIDNISLLIKNADVSKTARLSGSDDGNQWFAVKEYFALNYISNPESVNELRAIEFPLTNYKYYLLEISDSTSSPINILKAGYYDAAATHGLYSEIADSYTIKTETKHRQTFIKLSFSNPQLIDKLELSMKGTPFFQRDGSILTTETRRFKKRTEHYDIGLENFIVRSGQTTVINLNAVKTNNLTLRIENGDNPVLSVNGLKLYQLNRYLIAWLEKDETYSVGFGPENQKSPSYDLAYFRDSIPDNPQVLTVNNLKSAETPVTVSNSGFFNNKTITWIAIAAVILLLGVMSLRLVRETNASKKNEP